MPGPVFERKMRVGARTKLENYCLILRNTMSKKACRDQLYGGDPDHKLHQAVEKLTDWLNKNQLAKKHEFENQWDQIESVVTQVMNAQRLKEHEEEINAQRLKELEEIKARRLKELEEINAQRLEELEEIKAQRLKWKPPLPTGPPPSHLLSGRPGPYVR